MLRNIYKYIYNLSQSLKISFFKRFLFVLARNTRASLNFIVNGVATSASFPKFSNKWDNINKSKGPQFPQYQGEYKTPGIVLVLLSIHCFMNKWCIILDKAIRRADRIVLCSTYMAIWSIGRLETHGEVVSNYEVEIIVSCNQE